MPKSRAETLKVETVESRIKTEDVKPDALKKGAAVTKILDYYPLSEKQSTATNGELNAVKTVEKLACDDFLGSLKTVGDVTKRQSRMPRQGLPARQTTNESKQEVVRDKRPEVDAVRDEALSGDPDVSATLKEDISANASSAAPFNSITALREDPVHSGIVESRTAAVVHTDLSWTTVEGKKKKGGKPRTSVSSKSAIPRQSVNRLVTDYFPIRRSDRSTTKEQKALAEEHLRRKIESACEDGLKVITITGKGRGVVTENPIKRGDFVVEYAGDLIDQLVARKREGEYAAADRGCYMYYFNHKNKHYCVDATEESGRLGRLLNHSKQGNCMTKLIEVCGLPRLIIVAARDIEAGEELLYDYGDRSKASLELHPWLKT